MQKEGSTSTKLGSSSPALVSKKVSAMQKIHFHPLSSLEEDAGMGGVRDRPKFAGPGGAYAATQAHYTLG